MSIRQRSRENGKVREGEEQWRGRVFFMAEGIRELP